MPERSMDWLRQAEKDLQKAKLDLEAGFFEWGLLYGPTGFGESD